MYNFDALKYTFKHRKIVKALGNKYFPDNKELLNNLEKHDLDKMYLMLFFEKKDTISIHRDLNKHHQNNLEKGKVDYIEMVLDWESARYTKPDKPLNAYDTLYKFYPELEDKILPILKELKIDKSNLPFDEDILKISKKLDNATEEDIKNDLIEYIKNM